MKALIGVLAIMATLIGVSLIATEVFGDRDLFTPPPVTAAESFVHQVVTKRYDRAKPYFADPDRVSRAELRSLSDEIERRVGQPSRLRVEIVSRDDSNAETTVRLESERGSCEIGVALVWEKGEWKVRRESLSFTINSLDACSRTECSA